MFRNIISIAFLSALLIVLLGTNVFAYTVPIENSGKHKYKSVRLTPEIYYYAKEDLSDILIKDENDENVPFFINSKYLGYEEMYEMYYEYEDWGSDEEFYEDRYPDSPMPAKYFLETNKPKFIVENENKTTYINVEGLKNLRLSQISIKTDSEFRRMVDIPAFGTVKEVYNLNINGKKKKDTTINLDWELVKDEILIMTIDNGDDKPIDIKSITVKYYADDLVFEGRKDGKYTICFGSDGAKKAPSYDIGTYSKEILEGKLDKLKVKKVDFAKQKEASGNKYKTWFNVAVAVVAVILGILILLKLRKKS